mgnify:CR=1 FL=1
MYVPIIINLERLPGYYWLYWEDMMYRQAGRILKQVYEIIWIKHEGRYVTLVI